MTEQIVTGFHAIEEKVKSSHGKTEEIKKIRIFYCKEGPRVKKIIQIAKETGISCENLEKSQIDKIVQNLPEELKDHRGIVMKINSDDEIAKNIVDFDSWLKICDSDSKKDSQKKFTVLILDRITDPHNAGAIIRSCDQFGVNLVIVPEKNSVGNLTKNEVVARSSAGAVSWIPICSVTNLVRTVEKLKNSGFWIYGADAGGENCTKITFANKSVLIMGNEGSGIAKLLKQQCDSIVSIPTVGKIDSLNVSVAAGVLLYEIFKTVKVNH